MESATKYNYEDAMHGLNEVLDQIANALEKRKPLSLGRYGHGEIALLCQSDFNDAYYAGATVSAATISNDLLEALKTTDIIGFHASWGYAVEDREAAEITKKLLLSAGLEPTNVCSAFITHEMIHSDKFWECLKNRKVALVGRRAEEACLAFKARGIDIVYTSGFEGYADLEKVYNELSMKKEWDIALLAAGIPATILAPRLAKRTNKVVIDFGHALDMLIDGESFNYNKLVKDWKEVVSKKMLVSIVMAVYNGEKFVKEAIEGALSQTYKNIEIIIVNDGSTDSTRKILDNIDDKRVRIIHLKQNQGAANALNTGIKQANGFWIAIQDADDKYYPTKIEEQIKYASLHPELVGVGTLINCISGGPEISNGSLRGFAKFKNSFITRKDIRNKMFWGCPLTHSAMMFKKDIFWEVGGYDTDFKIAYDHDLWLKLLEKGEIENTPMVLLDYRIYKKSLSNKNAIATVNEIQIVSSKGIYRLLSNGGIRQPKVAVIGPFKALKNYNDNIAPATDLIVETISYRDWRIKVSNAIKKIRVGKIDALIVLEDNKCKNIIEKYVNKHLKLNENLFVIYNILM